MPTKGQIAVENALQKMIKNLQSDVSDVKGRSLDIIDQDVEADLTIAKEMVKEHNMEGSVFQEFKEKLLHVAYEGAGKRTAYMWQAKFAKKYGL